ncbi:MAG: sulfatase [Saprospirales bacterium TMED214]|nr:MAG: sulfatase [Saprospirales bacterium TMED214]
MNYEDKLSRLATRRQLFRDCGVGLGGIALSSLLEGNQALADGAGENVGVLHHPAKAKNVIVLFMAGGPSQLELFSHKPKLNGLHGKETPKEFIEGKRFSFLGKDAKLLGSNRKYKSCGESGIEISELLPFHQKIADKLCFIHSMNTDVFNHGPAKIFMNSGNPQPGRPSMGSWVTYGIGSECQNLPGFVVLQSGPRGPRAGAALWSSGFLPSKYQGVPFRSSGDPIVNLASPADFRGELSRDFHDAVAELNRKRLQATGDSEIETRIAAYEMAYRMQSSAPELMDISDESQQTMDSYGAKVGGASYANNCLLARRLVERGVRFVQLYHTDWDHHGGPGQTLGKDLEKCCSQVDRASAALIQDLEDRGLLDETLVVWTGEFGRTPMGETRNRKVGGRDHFIDAYTLWMAGGGVKPGVSYGATDELGLSVTENPVHVRDLHATILHSLGIDHEKFSVKFQGLKMRLTGVEEAKVIHEILT